MQNHFLDQVSAKLDKDIDDNEVDDKLLSVKEKELKDALIGDKQIKDSGSLKNYYLFLINFFRC